MYLRISITLVLIIAGIIASCSANAERSETDNNIQSRQG